MGEHHWPTTIALIVTAIAVGVLLLAVLYVIYRDQITQQKALKLTRDLRIPVETDHPFQCKPITDSIPSRSPVPEQTDH